MTITWLEYTASDDRRIFFNGSAKNVQPSHEPWRRHRDRPQPAAAWPHVPRRHELATRNPISSIYSPGQPRLQRPIRAQTPSHERDLTGACMTSEHIRDIPPRPPSGTSCPPDSCPGRGDRKSALNARFRHTEGFTTFSTRCKNWPPEPAPWHTYTGQRPLHGSTPNSGFRENERTPRSVLDSYTGILHIHIRNTACGCTLGAPGLPSPQ
jgi:hypothetical protein